MGKAIHIEPFENHARSMTLVTTGAGGSIDTFNLADPVVGFVFGQKGLMYNLTMAGSKLTKLKRQ